MSMEKMEKIFANLAIQAGYAIMEIYHSENIAVSQKDDKSPVTQADEIADDMIYQGLTKAFGDMPIVTEEKAQSHALRASRFIIVDPLDGTKEFINKSNQFTVNIAYVEDGRPITGCVYAPALGEMYLNSSRNHAYALRGDFAKPETLAKTRLNVSKRCHAPLNFVASKSHRDQRTDDYIKLYGEGQAVAAGSSLKFCLVARGDADIYPRLGRTMAWDTAAGHAVLLAAGGRVLRFDDHQDLIYNSDDFANPYFIACNGLVPLKRADVL